MNTVPLLTRLEELIARLEKATGPDRDFDAEIHAAANDGYVERDVHLGKTRLSIWNQDNGWQHEGTARQYRDRKYVCDGYRAPNYTSSIDAALTLVPEWMTWAAGDCGPDNDCPWACITGGHDADYPDFDASAATPALAVCIAALRASQDLQEDGK